METAPKAPFLTIAATMAKINSGRTQTYKLLNAGKLRAVKAGKRTLVEDASIDAYLASLPAYQPKAA